MTQRIELPWALPTRKRHDGKAPFQYFYFRTKAEADKSYAYAQRKSHRLLGPVEHRPGECYQVGGVLS